MKVLVVANSGWNIKNFREDLIKGLISEGSRVEIASPLDEYVSELKDLGCSHTRIDFKARGLNPFNELYVFLQTIKIVKNSMPDIILSFTIKPNIYFGLASRALNIPIISNITGLGKNFLTSRIRAYLFRILYKIALRKVSRCVFQNIYDQNYFVNSKIIAKPKAVIISGSGINLKRFMPSKDANKKKIWKKKKFRFLYTGRIIEDKGILELLGAAKLIKEDLDIDIKIVGKFEHETVSKKLKQTFNSAIESKIIDYHEFVKDIRPQLLSSDCLVQPSYREGSSRSIMEAMALGLPVIATDVPGCNNLVQNDFNGFLCKPKNTLDLYLKMKKVFSLSTKRRKTMGLLGRKIIEKHHSVDGIVSQYLKVIKKIKLDK